MLAPDSGHEKEKPTCNPSPFLSTGRWFPVDLFPASESVRDFMNVEAVYRPDFSKAIRNLK